MMERRRVGFETSVLDGWVVSGRPRKIDVTYDIIYNVASHGTHTGNIGTVIRRRVPSSHVKRS